MKKIGRAFLWPLVLVIATSAFIGLVLLWIGFRKKWQTDLNTFYRAVFDYRIFKRSKWYTWDKKRFDGFVGINDSAMMAIRMMKKEFALTGQISDYSGLT